ncbi:MAG: translation initiation factor IF-2 [Candidatus Pacebacteria bacterium]|nr:translation initiation factor IF-2 [Candidatus Paceibacterota bacterium]
MSNRLRVYELARELGLSSKEMIDLLQAEGVEVKRHASSIDEEMAELVREQVIAERNAKSRAAAKAAESAVETVTVEEEEAEEALDEEEEDIGATHEIHLKPPITVRDLAKAMGRKPNEIIGTLMTMNVFATINQVIEPDVAERICEKFDLHFVRERRERVTKGPKKKAAPGTAEEKEEAKGGRRPVTGHAPRPPVVTFLGHVDHGKTSLLDAIRETHVTQGESGGITQHIGASVVTWDGHQITFLDTPGHEAFTAMRARGANATDIVVLVVAADDGVMPQTVEAIHHARAAGVPIVVAMNKIDLPGANPDKVLTGLQEQEVTPEEWGGQTGVVPVSAVAETGLDDLLERIVLEAEIMELKGNPSLPAEGLVIEAQLETGMGPTANILVRNGTLHVGDVVLCGAFYGRAKALIGQDGKRVKGAGPSTPVKVLGLSGVPDAGELFSVLDDEREAKARAEARTESLRTGDLEAGRGASLEDLFQQMSEASRAQLKLVLKTDVRGSLEAIVDSLKELETEKVDLDIIHKDVGEITNNDVLLASASGAIVAGFHVRVMPGVNKSAKQQGVEIRLYSVIYELLEDIREAMRGQLEPEQREKHIGEAEIREVFQVSKTGKICGCVIQQGVVHPNANARVIRDGDVIYNGQIASLRHFKDEVREVRAGQECGIRLDNFEDFEVGDKIEVFEIQKVAPEL